ncbi:helix-turn-helix domain-containing protein [Paenibacillus solisilvae]|uniref:Helix-turn-helix domain-containing protein n=1 Tax=Paenibacillus solisilvae TaxID=2486751 RepID=A0ABW0VUG7_9BACL
MLKWRLASGTFQKTFLSYFGILMIPILVFSTVNMHRNVKEEQDRLYEKHMTDAQRTSDLMDNKLNELQNAGKVLSQESWVRKRMESSNVFDQDFDVLNMLDIKKDLQNLIGSLDIVSFGAVIYPEKHLVLTPWGSYAENDFFSDVAVFDDAVQRNLLDDVSLYRFFDIGMPISVRAWGTVKKVIPVLQSLEVVGHPRATLVLFIDNAYLSEFLNRFGGIDSIDFTISVNDAIVYKQVRSSLSDPSREERTQGELKINSQASDWQYTISYYDDSLIGVKNLVGSLLAILISIVVGTLAAYGLAKISYRPLAALLNKLSIALRDDPDAEPARSGCEYNRIENSFEQLIHENQSLQRAVSDYELAARSNLLLRLLKGYFTADQQMVDFRKFGVGYTNDMYYCTMLLRFDSFHDCTDIARIQQIELITIIVAEQVFKRCSLDYELFEVTDADKAIIVSLAQPFADHEVMGRIASDIAAGIERACQVQPDIWHGAVEQGLIGISKSYYAANESLQMAVFMRGHVQERQEEAVHPEVHYYYPTDWEVQLINNLKVGNLDTSIHILSEIRAENERRNLPAASIIRLVSLLLETMLRVLTELNIDAGIYAKQFGSRVDTENIGPMWGYVFEVGTVICERIQYSNTPSAMEIGGKLLHYVKMNYTETDVSLKTLAAIFEMSVSGVSKTFKEVAGVNFYDYLCRLRMERAKELLREQPCEIDKVASRVGYENVYSFKRAFVRYEGIKPNEYTQKSDKHYA